MQKASTFSRRGHILLPHSPPIANQAGTALLWTTTTSFSNQAPPLMKILATPLQHYLLHSRLACQDRPHTNAFISNLHRVNIPWGSPLTIISTVYFLARPPTHRNLTTHIHLLPILFIATAEWNRGTS